MPDHHLDLFAEVIYRLCMRHANESNATALQRTVHCPSFKPIACAFKLVRIIFFCHHSTHAQALCTCLGQPKCGGAVVDVSAGFELTIRYCKGVQCIFNNFRNHLPIMPHISHGTDPEIFLTTTITSRHADGGSWYTVLTTPSCWLSCPAPTEIHRPSVYAAGLHNRPPDQLASDCWELYEWMLACTTAYHRDIIMHHFMIIHHI